MSDRILFQKIIRVFPETPYPYGLDVSNLKKHVIPSCKQPTQENQRFLINALFSSQVSHVSVQLPQQMVGHPHALEQPVLVHTFIAR